MQPGLALPSSPSSMRPSMSHMFNPFSQQARPAALSGPPPPPSYAANPLAQAAPSRPMDRSGAGYMASSRRGHQGNDSTNQRCHLKPSDCCGPGTSSCYFAMPIHSTVAYWKVLYNALHPYGRRHLLCLCMNTSCDLTVDGHSV